MSIKIAELTLTIFHCIFSWHCATDFEINRQTVLTHASLHLKVCSVHFDVFTDELKKKNEMKKMAVFSQTTDEKNPPRSQRS